VWNVGYWEDKEDGESFMQDRRYLALVPGWETGQRGMQKAKVWGGSIRTSFSAKNPPEDDPTTPN